MTDRTFTIVDYPKRGDTYGRYIASHPIYAAKKALTQLSRKIDLENTNKKNIMVFTIRETTNNSNKNLYKYAGTRIKLDKPLVVKRNGKKIVYKYRNIITDYNKLFSN